MIRAAALVGAALLCGACGTIGPVLPPALHLPSRVTDLTAVQRGDRILIHFTMPAVTTEAMPIRETPTVEVKLGEASTHFEEAQWIAHARTLPDQGKNTAYSTNATEFAGHTLVVAVRLLNDRGKTAGWSNFVQLPISLPLARPQNVVAAAVPNGVELRWSGSAPLFRIYRRDRPGAEFAPLGEAPASPWTDTTAEFGKPYTYMVQGLSGAAANASASDLSAEITITPQDTFPPAVPANVRVILGTKSVELSWDRNTEPDLAGYRVYRSEGDGPFTLAADHVAASNWSDRAAKPGSRVRYAVTSLDTVGNESARSNPVEVVVPQ